MKHLKTITTALAILLFAVSCKKQSVEPAPIAVASKKLQSTTWTAGWGTNYTYTYDTQGRLVKEEDTYEMETYAFTGNTVHITDYDKTKARIVQDLSGTLDNAGRMISYTNAISYNINSPYTEQGAFTYDADGYLLQCKLTSNNLVYTYDYTVANGDYTKVVYQLNGQGGYTQSSDFYTDKNDQAGINYEVTKNFGFNNGLFGKTSTHLLKYQQLLQKGVVTPSWTKNLSYTFDNDGYVQTADLTGTWTASAIYTFQ